MTQTYGEKWLTLLGYYAAHEDSAAKALFHERVERCVSQLNIDPLEFIHPMEPEVCGLFSIEDGPCTSVFVAGEAGVGKTQLVHKIHAALGGSPAKVRGRGAYWVHEGVTSSGIPYRVHINRDLSAWRNFGAEKSSTEEKKLVERWSQLILGEGPGDGTKEYFVIAANDGQLLKAWQDNAETASTVRALEKIEEALRGASSTGNFRLFHMSSVESKTVLQLCIDALLAHPGWIALESEHSGVSDIFCAESPLKRNYLALSDQTIRRRLESLAVLCEANQWHLPVRNILAILANAILGVSNKDISKSGVMDGNSLRVLMAEKKYDASNFFENILGLNLSASWRERMLGPLEYFRIGHETYNIADNLILFGMEDEDYQEDYETVFLKDPVFPPDAGFETQRSHYLSQGPATAGNDEDSFQLHLIAQRQRLFFRIPAEMEAIFNPWGLTNFQDAKSYLDDILGPGSRGTVPHRRYLGPLILALNRIWTGLLLEEKDALHITTALDLATGHSSEIEVRQIPSFSASGGEYPFVDFEGAPAGANVPRIAIHLKSGAEPIALSLSLTRYEFLRRVASGALAASFSRECAEDIRAFKSKILARLPMTVAGSLKILHVNSDGTVGRTTLNLVEC